jgi:hypothetical protein
MENKINLEPEVRVTARVFRVETGEWEDLGVISQTEGFREGEETENEA